MVDDFRLNKHKRTPSPSPPTSGFDVDDTGRPMPKRRNPGVEDEQASMTEGRDFEDDETMRHDSDSEVRPSSARELSEDEGSLWHASKGVYEGRSEPTPQPCSPIRRRYDSEGTEIEDRSEDLPEVVVMPEHVQHGSVWFEDGNIVLCAGVTGFRVHTSILSRQSEVLKDKFSDHGRLREMDGCPVMHLEDDPRDLAVLLEVMYGFRSLTPGHSLPFETVSACLRLGNDYQVESIRQAAHEILRSCYPSTLQEVDRTDLEFPYRITGTATLDFEVALLAHDQDLDHVLVMALYRCCSIPPWELMHRLGLDGGPERRTLEPTMPCGQEILQKYLCGRAELVRVCATYTLGFLDGMPRRACESYDTCRQGLKRLLGKAHRAGLLFDNACALRCQDGFIDEATDGMDVCVSCFKNLKTRHREGREKVLGMLPEIFRV